jgi:hypothetical protein
LRTYRIIESDCEFQIHRSTLSVDPQMLRMDGAPESAAWGKRAKKIVARKIVAASRNPTSWPTCT